MRYINRCFIFIRFLLNSRQVPPSADAIMVSRAGLYFHAYVGIAAERAEVSGAALFGRPSRPIC
jgi:hypothetical protein